jgi:T5SS/PEP-CTERM-associated repeat protein
MSCVRSTAARYAFGAARRLRCQLGVGAAALLLLLLPAITRADVIGIGDVTPAADDPESGELVPDLPVAGGTVDDPIIVGGTGQMIGDTDTGSMVIDSPAFTAPLISDTGVIGGTDVGSGIVQIFSVGSQWRLNEKLSVGENGRGLLELINGGQVSDNPPGDLDATDLTVFVGEFPGSAGFVNARGVGSLLRSAILTIGREGFGSMDITTRASVTTLQTAVIGDMAGDISSGGDIGTGLVTVDGELTRWTIGGPTTGSLTVGNAGRGALNITNQGEVRVTNPSATGGDVIIGGESGGLGEVLITGQLSQLWAFGEISIGEVPDARGVVRVADQGRVRANDTIEIGRDGVLEVSGGTVLTTAVNNGGVIQTSTGGIGQIDSPVVNMSSGEIRAAGTVDRVRERLLFTKDVTNAGLITSIGGDMEFTSTATNSSGGTIAGRDAIYRFRNVTGLANEGILGFSVGASDVYGDIFNKPGGSIAVAHNTDVTFYNDVSNNGSLDVMPGGTAIFLRNLIFGASAELNVQLDQIASVEEIGQLQIAGEASLDGTLAAIAFTTLDPQPGDSYQIITAGSVTGTFADFIPPTNAPGDNWVLEYTPTSVILNFVAAPAFSADFNGDGVVNGLDRQIIQDNFGLGATFAQGDADFDGDVDGNDFLIWQRQIGPVPAPANLAAGAVPEPGALSMALALAALAIPAWRRRTR